MNRLLILLILFGSQIGLSDFLLLPVYAARHGELTFLALYAIFKLAIVLPLLHAELVAGRLYRITPFEWLQTGRMGGLAPWLLAALVLAVICAVALTLHNASWTLAITADAMQGQLDSFDGLDRILYWYELGADQVQLSRWVLLQVLILACLAWFAWYGMAFAYAVALPLCLLFILTQIPQSGALLNAWSWGEVTAEGVQQALKYALLSSVAGFLVWYLVGTRLPQSLPTGYWVLSVQLFDLWLGLSIVSAVYPGLTIIPASSGDAGLVLQGLVEQIARGDIYHNQLLLFMFVAAVIGMLSSVPLLLLISLSDSGQTRRGGLLLALLAAGALALLLLVSVQVESALTWRGMPFSDLLSGFSYSFVVPIVALLICWEVGWHLPPNQVLKQVNPRVGGRYLAWRASLKFVIPSALALTFTRDSLGLSGASLSEILAVIALVLLIIQLARWFRRQAIYPGS
jgi:SNF family Na+-dependent transporter